MKRKNLRDLHPYIIMVAAVTVMVSAAIVFKMQFKPEIRKLEPSTASLAKFCTGQSADKFECQKNYYEMLYQTGGMQVSYGALKRDYAAIASVKSNCHQLTHAVGRAAGHKYKDVSKAYAEGDELCSSGYYHGVMEAILDNDKTGDVRTKLDSICDGVSKTHQYKLAHHNCTHGLGHGLMFIEGDELFVSLEGCDRLSDNWEKQSCYGGVFMENIMASTNPDHKTNYIKSDDPLYPCTAVKDQYLSSCYLMQSSQALKVVNYNYSEMFALCDSIQDWVRATCYESVGRDASGLNAQSSQSAKELCLLGSTQQGRRGCVIGAVKDIVWFYHDEKPGTQFCESLPLELRQVCHETKRNYVATF